MDDTPLPDHDQPDAATQAGAGRAPHDDPYARPTSPGTHQNPRVPPYQGPYQSPHHAPHEPPYQGPYQSPHQSQHQAPGTPPPGADAGRTSPLRSFFSSLRRTGLVRSEERWVGGVAGGLAQHLGVDPVLVRCVWLVLMLLSGLGLVVYGLAWALLPEQRDGRIHVEQALHGDITAGLAGAVVAVITGFGMGEQGFVPTWYVLGWTSSSVGKALMTLFWVGLILVAVWALARRRRDRGPEPTGDPQWAQQPATATDTAQGRAAAEDSWTRGAPAAPSAPETPGAWPAPAAPSAPGTPPPAKARTASAPPSSPGASSAPAVGTASAAPGTRAASTGPASPAAPGGPAATGAWSASAATAPPGAWAAPAAPTTVGAPPTWQTPAPAVAPRPVSPPGPPVPGPGRTLSLLILALVMFTLAAAGWASTTGRLSLPSAFMAGVGLLTTVFGVGVVISALRGRRGDWISLCGFLALTLAVPSLLIGSVVGVLDGRIAGHRVEITVTDEMLQDTAGSLDLGDYAVGHVVIDLRGVSEQAAQGADIAIEVGVGEVEIITAQGQAITVNAQVGVGSVNGSLAQAWRTVGMQRGYNGVSAPIYVGDGQTYSVSGELLLETHASQDGLGLKAQLSSPAAQGVTEPLAVDVEVGVGQAHVSERHHEVTWVGWIYDSYWVVDSWHEPSGASHSGDDLPVPGMTASALSSTDVRQCTERVGEQQAQADTTDAEDINVGDVEPWSLDDLPSDLRTRVDTCLMERLSEREGAEPAGAQDRTGPQASATASPPASEPTATASPEASATPSH